jgi:hypothetical protein
MSKRKLASDSALVHKKKMLMEEKAVVLGKDRTAKRDSGFYESDSELTAPSIALDRAAIISEQAIVPAPNKAKWQSMIMSKRDALARVGQQGRVARNAALAKYGDWRDAMSLLPAESKIADYDMEQYVAIAETGEPKDETYFLGNHLDTPLQMPMDLFFALASWNAIHDALHANAIRIWHLCQNLFRTTNASVIAALFDEEGDDFEVAGDHAASVIEQCAFKSLFENGTCYIDEGVFSLAFLAPLDGATAENGDLERALAYTMMLPFDGHRWFRALLERTAQMIKPNDRAAVLVRAACYAPECAAFLAQIARRNGWTREQLELLVIKNLGFNDVCVANAHASLLGCQVRTLDKHLIMEEFDLAPSAVTV